jgi:hypothetical protein
MSSQAWNPGERGPGQRAESGFVDGYLLLEVRPERPVVAIYDRLPFPHLGIQQEIVFDLGVTAKASDQELAGVVFRGYHDHQLLFEQRWSAEVIRRHTGESDLTIAAETGLALRSLHFILHGYQQLSHVECLVVGKEKRTGRRIEAKLDIPVRSHDQQTELHLPLVGAWWVIQGNDWSDRHKQEVFSQPYALDFVKLGADNNFFQRDGHALEDHYSWNQPVYAAAGGKVALTIYDMPDLAPGAPSDPRIFRNDPRRLLGNAIAISHANGEFSYYGHLQQASIQVNEGQLVRRGALLGRVGNSGQSPGPHLHFHLMEGPNLLIDQGLPAKFSHFSAGGALLTEPVFIPTRMIIFGKEKESHVEHERR